MLPYRFVGPVLRLLDPETAHGWALRALRRGLVPAQAEPDDPILASRLWDRDFANPVGLAAGFEKDGEAIGPLLGLGFGLVEIGSVTPGRQAGNPRPRLFRLEEDRAVINRMGFNSAGHGPVAAALAAWRAKGASGPLGVNFGKNLDSEDPAGDYAAGVRALGRFADYLVVNVSSPNTPGLRALQGRDSLNRLLEGVLAVRAEACPLNPPPLLVKVAPDLEAADKADIASVALARGIDGLVVSNTTIARPPGLKSRHRSESGGLSGRPLFAPSTAVLADFYRLTEGRLPIIGVGGIASGAEAYAKIRAGASLVQLYTAFAYEGPGLIPRLKRDLAACLRRDGFESLAAAVGADHRP